MVDILIQPPELRRISEELRTSAQKIGSALQAIDNDIRSLKGDKFLGSRSDKVQVNYAPKREALLKAKNIIFYFADDLQSVATRFEQADKQKRKIVYLVNGINYSSKGGNDGLNHLIDRIKEQYGDNVDIRIVGGDNSELHPYNTDNIPTTHFGGWLSPLDYLTGSGSYKTVYGIVQVASEYISGWGTESNKVYNWIKSDLALQGLTGDNIDMVLAGYSGGGAIVSNIVDRVEKEIRVNVTDMYTIASPLSNFDRAHNVENIVDLRFYDDLATPFGIAIRGFQTISLLPPWLKNAIYDSNPSQYLIDKFFFNNPNVHPVYMNPENGINPLDTHIDDYFDSSQVSDALGKSTL